MRQRIISVLVGTTSLLAIDAALLAMASAQAPASQSSGQRSSASAGSLPARMHEHALTLLDRGDVAAAREFLEVSAGDGFGESARVLALTYDATSLRERRLPTNLADTAARARWAARAAELGRPVAVPVTVPVTAPVTVVAEASPIEKAPTPKAAPVISEQVSVAKPQAVVTPPAATSFADGTYSSHILAGCGEGFQSVLVTIARGEISFEHLLKGVSYGWRGTIDTSGAITARVAGNTGHSAVGRFDEKTIDMTYPQCGSKPMTMRIRWLVR